MVLSGAAKEVERDGTVNDVTFRAIPYSTWNNPRCRPDGSMDSRSQGICNSNPRTDHSQQGTDVQHTGTHPERCTRIGFGHLVCVGCERPMGTTPFVGYFEALPLLVAERKAPKKALPTSSTSLIPYRTCRCTGSTSTTTMATSACRKAGNYIIRVGNTWKESGSPRRIRRKERLLQQPRLQARKDHRTENSRSAPAGRIGRNHRMESEMTVNN